MTDREKAIIMAYTGACMLTGDKFQIFHKYVEDIMGRPIMTHEIGFLADSIKEKAKADFIELCSDDDGWIPVSHRLPMLNEEAYSDEVLIQLKDTMFEISISEGAGVVHITKIARYDESAISSDGIYMDTEGWVLEDGGTLSIDEVIAWMPLPKPLKKESEGEE